MVVMSKSQREELPNLYTNMIESVKPHIISNELCVILQSIGRCN